MANDHKPIKDRDAGPRFDVRALARAQTEQVPPTAQSLTLETAPPKADSKADSEMRGFDPYNTTGGFDRKKHWTQVRKR